MEGLKRLTDIVKAALEADERCRNSDNFLYLTVLCMLGKNTTMSVANFLLHMNEHNIPPFESVRRTRQKLQRKYPHLRACSAVEGYRAENEEVYREFARS